MELTTIDPSKLGLGPAKSRTKCTFRDIELATDDGEPRRLTGRYFLPGYCRWGVGEHSKPRLEIRHKATRAWLRELDDALKKRVDDTGDARVSHPGHSGHLAG